MINRVRFLAASESPTRATIELTDATDVIRISSLRQSNVSNYYIVAQFTLNFVRVGVDAPVNENVRIELRTFEVFTLKGARIVVNMFLSVLMCIAEKVWCHSGLVGFLPMVPVNDQLKCEKF